MSKLINCVPSSCLCQMSNNRLKSIKYRIRSSACSTNCRFLGGFGLGFARPEPKIFNMRTPSTVRRVLFGTLPTDPIFHMVCPICLTLPSNSLPNCVSCPCLDPIVSVFMHPDACADFFGCHRKTSSKYFEKLVQDPVD